MLTLQRWQYNLFLNNVRLYYGTDNTYTFTKLKEGHTYQISLLVIGDNPDAPALLATLQSEWQNMTVTTTCSDSNCGGSGSVSPPSTGGAGLLVAPVAFVTGLLVLIM